MWSKIKIAGAQNKNVHHTGRKKKKIRHIQKFGAREKKKLYCVQFTYTNALFVWWSGTEKENIAYAILQFTHAQLFDQSK